MRRHIVSTKGTREWQGIPAIERAANGRLWCSFFTGGPKEPAEGNFIVLTTSDDDGVTWSSPIPVVVSEPPGRAYDPALWHDPSGRLWLFYNQSNRATKDHSLWAITTDDSIRPAPRWSDPKRIDLGVPFAFRLNKPTVIASGEWLLPVTWAPSAPDGWVSRSQELQGVAISGDSGATWTFHGGVESPVWALENMIVECLDGTLWMLIRTGSGVLWQSFSSDRGRTWAKGAPTAIVNPGARFFIRRLASGRLLLINTPDPKQRKKLVAQVADRQDDTRFIAGVELDDRDQVSYPDAVQNSNGLIYAVHDRDRKGLGEIVLSVFSEEEILATSERMNEMTRRAPNSQSWTRVAESCAFSIRDTAEPIVFQDAMWLSNGYEKQGVLIRDLWRSTDGSEWTRVSESTPYDGYSEMVVYRDKIWAVKESVWNSADGLEWNRVSAATPFGARGYGELVVFQDRMWQLGSGPDVWRTNDGVQWERIIERAPYGPRYGSAVAVYQDKLWLMGGATVEPAEPRELVYPKYTTHHDVWCSADGTNWTQVLKHAPWAARMWVVAIVYSGKLWIIGGFSNRQKLNYADAWYTEDGITWHECVSTPMFSPRHEVTPYVYKGSLWVVAGNSWPLTNDVWKLTLPQ